MRSHALAYVLHDLKGHEAIAVGRLRTSPETMDMLCGWAQRIVLMQPHMLESISENHRSRVLVTDVGVDRFGIYIHPELFSMASDAATWLEAR